jgi:ADP-heptose:LPS heptosyltransferase
VRILLIRLRLIGDVVFTTPVVAALRRRFPHAHLAYVVEPPAAPVVAANPHLDEVIVAASPATRRIGDDLALARRIGQGRFDVAIDLHGGPRSAMLAWLSRAPRRIGYEIPARRWMYTEQVARSRTLRPRHSVVNQWDLLRPLGFDDPSPETDPTEMPASRAAAESVAGRLRAAGIEPSLQPLIVVHVSAGNPFRRWPADSFVELVTRLARTDERRRILVISGPSERDAARDISGRARVRLQGAESSVVDDFEVDLVELRALMDRSALFIGGDSGPLHVAGTSRVPIVGIYGPTLPARSAPWRPARFVTESVELPGLPCRPCHQRVCEPGDFRCLGQIPAERLAEAAERALRRAAQGQPVGPESAQSPEPR